MKQSWCLAMLPVGHKGVWKTEIAIFPEPIPKDLDFSVVFLWVFTETQEFK